MTFAIFGKREPMPNPANPKVGASVEGITLFDGWANPRLLDYASINFSGGWLDSAAISPTNKHLLDLSYCRWDFSKFHYQNGLIEVTGPSLPGMVGDKFKVFTLDIVTGAVTYHPGNLNDPNVHVSSQALNAARNEMMVTLWDHQGRADAQLARSVLSASWSQSTLMAEPPVNTPANDDNGFLSPGIIYLDSNRDGPNRVFQTIQVGGEWLPPGQTPGLWTLDSNDYQPSVSPNGSQMYWTSQRGGTYGIYAGDRDTLTGIITNARPLALLPYTQPMLGKAALIGEFTVAEFPNKFLGYFMCGICDGVDVNGSPNSAALKVCLMSKAK